jgi:hypothetical protein
MRSSLGHPARLSGQEEAVRHATSAENSVSNAGLCLDASQYSEE